MKKLDTIFSVFVFVFAVTVFPVNAASAQVGGYMGVFGGYAVSTESSPWYYDHDYDYHGNYDIDIEETWMIGFKLGYTPPRLRFASFEFEYSYSNPDVERTVWTYRSRDYEKIVGDAAFNNFMFNGIAKFPAGKIHPYIGAGIGFSYIDASVSSSSTGRSDSNEDKVFAWQILGGVEIDLTRNLSVDIGYRFFVTESDPDDDYYYHDEYDSTDLDYETSIVTFGLKYSF